MSLLVSLAILMSDMAKWAPDYELTQKYCLIWDVRTNNQIELTKQAGYDFILDDATRPHEFYVVM